MIKRKYWTWHLTWLTKVLQIVRSKAKRNVFSRWSRSVSSCYNCELLLANLRSNWSVTKDMSNHWANLITVAHNYNSLWRRNFIGKKMFTLLRSRLCKWRRKFSCANFKFDYNECEPNASWRRSRISDSCTSKITLILLLYLKSRDFTRVGIVSTRGKRLREPRQLKYFPFPKDQDQVYPFARDEREMCWNAPSLCSYINLFS